MLDENLERASRPPTLKGGRYVVAGVLGKGGNAGVYQAWDTKLRQWRAIKVLSHEFIRDEEVRARFAQEAATMARLEHPNLVRVFDISDDPYTPHIVMEICAGGSVIQWMKAHGPVPPRLALSIIRQTALGVQCAHADGIIHRDIKPQNILITHKGVIKLTDFGIARDSDNSLTQAGATIGTYAFMAPEQRHDSTMVDERADVYSLGATLFTMLQVKTTTELFVAERGDELLEGIPEPALELILKACQYKPKNRYEDIPALIYAIDTALDALPPDPPHPALEALSISLPDEPPEGLPDFNQLGDLLKSLALHDDTPTYMERSDNTTLGNGTPSVSAPRAMPYVMSSGVTGSTGPTGSSGSSGSKADSGGPVERPSYIDEDEFQKVVPVVATPAPPPPVAQASLPAEPLPPLQNPIVLGAAVLAILLIGAVGCVFLGAGQVNDALERSVRADADLVDAIRASAPVVHSMENANAIQPLYFAATEGTPAERKRAAAAYLVEIEGALKRRDLPVDGIALIEGVQNAGARAKSAEQAWSAASASLLGSAAVAAGLAEAPEAPRP